MTRSPYRVVQFRPEHQAQLVRLQKALWSPYKALNGEYLDWKHFRNPYTDEPLIYLALLGDQLVGMRGFFGSKWQVGSPSQSFLAPGAADLVIAPGHRNRGLLAQLMEAALQDLATKGYSYAVSLSAGSLTFLSQIATGWRSIGSLQLMERSPVADQSPSVMRVLLKRSAVAMAVHRRLSNLGRRATGWLPGPPNPRHFAALDACCTQRSLTVAAPVTIERTPRPREMAELVTRLGNDGRIRHIQDEEYFGWRFQNPLSSYRFLFWHESRLEGYLVLRTSVLSWRPEIGVVAWEASSDQIRLSLMKLAVLLAVPGPLRIWSATLRKEEHRVLAEMEFRPAQQGITVNPQVALIRPIRDEMLGQEWLVDRRHLLDLGNWDLPMISSDGI